MSGSSMAVWTGVVEESILRKSLERKLVCREQRGQQHQPEIFPLRNWGARNQGARDSNARNYGAGIMTGDAMFEYALSSLLEFTAVAAAS